MLPLVSVIIPTYNRAHSVVRAIDSVLAQTIQDIEVIIVDDGSTDDTRKHILAYPSKVHYIRQKNSGPAAARNTGLSNARAQFIAFLDSDDTYLPNNLEKHLDVFSHNPSLGLVYAGSEVLDSEDRVVKVQIPSPQHRGNVLHFLLMNNFIMSSTVVMQRFAVDYAGLMHTKLIFGEDWHFWLKIASKYSIDFVPEVLVRYRRSNDSLSQNKLDTVVSLNEQMLDLTFADPFLIPFIQPFKKTTYARVYRNHASAAIMNLDMELARRLSLQSLRYNPTDLKTISIALKSLFGKRFLSSAKIIRDFLK